MSAFKLLFICLVSLGIWALGNFSHIRAHPFHTTTAEMEYNAESGRFEVAVKVPVFDLEEALTRQAARGVKTEFKGQSSRGTAPSEIKRVTLDTTAEVEHLIIAYLKTHFFLISAGNQRAVADTAGGEATDRDVAQTPSIAAVNESPAQAEAPQTRSFEPRSQLRWSGMELDKSSAWLYFELEPPAADKLSLVNELLFELNAQQINTLTLRTASAKFSIRTDARHPQAALPPQARSR